MRAANPFSHVFVSQDGGVTWRDIDNRRLPNAPHHAVTFQTDAPDSLFVAGDAGVFCSPDLGQSWINISRNLPNAMVVDLVYHDAERTLTAATYGRSLWRLKIA
jgi:photosystem II stability/assembly factor-like uncharacterized protein